MHLPDIAASVRRDEYTGENRCLPCTLVNVLVAATVAGAIAWAGYSLLAATVLIAALATIYLRGYLVPGTPTITQRYFPAPLLRLFGKEPAPERSARTDAADRASVTGGLFADGILAGSSEDPRLGPRFRGAWRDRVRTVRERDLGPTDVRAMLDAEECTAHGDVSFVVDGNKMVRWESEAALVADVAAAAALSTAFERWDRLDRSERLDVLAGLRLFLDRCPACDGPLSRTERDVDSCCQPSYTVLRSICEACGSTVADVSVLEPDDATPTRAQFLSS